MKVTGEPIVLLPRHNQPSAEGRRFFRNTSRWVETAAATDTASLSILFREATSYC